MGIFTSASGESGAKVSINQSMLLSALTIKLDDQTLLHGLTQPMQDQLIKPLQ